VAASET